VALPKIGLTAVLENSAGFQKSLDAINKKMAETSQKTKEASKNASPLSSALDKVGFSVDGLKNKISQFTGINAQAIDGLFEFTAAFGPMAVAVGAAVIGVAALAAGFLALGNRGAPLVGVARAFDNLAASVGLTSSALLIDLRKAANGTIADFDLIRTANIALSGATGKLGTEIGKNLPRLLEIATKQARVTGYSVDFLFNSIIEGIRKSSPRRIDNALLIIQEGKSYEAYAKSLGKSVEALTAEEKGVAILNATLEAGNIALEQSGKLQETNAEKIARAGATITNIFDTLSVAVQPAFATVLDIVNRVLGAFQNLAVGLAPILGAISSVITDVLGGAINAIFDIISPIVSAIASFLPYISILFQGIANVVHGAVEFIGNIIRGVVTFLQDVGKKLFGIDTNNLAKNLFESAAKIFGSFANAIIQVANKLIFPAIIWIAKGIADFLIGQSPPPMGPLSEIDKGGENLMLAWLDGIAGVSLDPVEQVAAEVSLALGKIGTASLPLVNKRIAQLDKELLPFQNRLAIVQSQFDAIAEPAKAALDAIGRQTEQAMQALAAGDTSAAATIRTLDAQREAIQANLDAQQGIVDRQQIQLGLATAAQAQERTLLNIRKAVLEATKKTTSAAQAAGAGAVKEPKAPAGAAPITTPGSAAGGFVTPGSSALDLIGGQQAVDDAIAGIQDAFAGQIDTTALGEFQTNQGLLQEQLGRFEGVDLGKKLGEKFKGLTDLFDSNVEGSPANVISKFFSPDPSTPGSLSGFVNSIGPTLDGLKSGIQASANEFFDSIFNPARTDSPANIIQTLFADAGTQGSIANTFSQLGPNLEAAAPAIQASLQTVFSDMFDPEVDGSVASVITGLVQQITGDEATANSVASFFAQLPENVSNAASGLWEQLQTGVFQPVSDFLTGQGEGLTLSGILDTAVQFFSELPSRIVAALQGIGATIYAAFAVPVLSVINSVIEAAENVVKSFLNGVADFLVSVADGLGGIIDTTSIRNTANDIKTKAGTVKFGRASTELPAFLVPAAAKGGLFGPGAIDVGEHGPERIFAASQIGILPTELTRVLDNLSMVLAQPAPMSIPAGDSYSNSSSTYNFNGVQSDNDARRRYNTLRAGMR
jgi:phage-related protein